MPPREWKLRVRDILDSIEAIGRHVQGLDSAAFAADAKTIDAVLHRFTVIGEAATAIPPEVVRAIRSFLGGRCERCGISSYTRISA